MVAFDRSATDMQRFDFLLLRDGPIILYHDAHELERASAWLTNHAYQLYRFDCKRWKTSDDFYEDFYTQTAPALTMDDCGHNRDAFRDCLFTFEVSMEGGAAFVFSHFDAFARLSQRYAYDILTSIAEVSRFNLLFGRRLLVLIHSDDPHLEFKPVDARPVSTTIWKPN